MTLASAGILLLCFCLLWWYVLHTHQNAAGILSSPRFFSVPEGRGSVLALRRPGLFWAPIYLATIWIRTLGYKWQKLNLTALSPMGTSLAHLTGKSKEWSQISMQLDIEDHQDLALLQLSLASFSQTFSLGAAPTPEEERPSLSFSWSLHIRSLGGD